MLAASDATPNTAVPRPANWCGVAESLRRARWAIAKGELEHAERLLKELLEFAPRELRAWKMLARLQRELGKIEEGIASAERALFLQEQSRKAPPVASVRLARLYWEQGERQLALEMLDEVLDQRAHDPELIALKASWERELFS
ncbi:MAG: tetratricopeptide repeat protein [Zetaproteobacteria bacterium]|nr:MAG: tetratricopeptide repeat protein [Zetaproteobacteria bacterium]